MFPTIIILHEEELKIIILHEEEMRIIFLHEEKKLSSYRYAELN